MDCRSSCFTSRGHHLPRAKHQRLQLRNSGASAFKVHAVAQLLLNYEQPENCEYLSECVCKVFTIPTLIYGEWG